MKKILCVDDDFDFAKLIVKSAQNLDVDITHAQTLKEGLIAIKKMRFDAYIIDGKLPDKPGLALVKFIREKIDKDVPIAFVSAHYRNTTTTQKIHEELKVNYVVNKPLSTQKIFSLIKKIADLDDKTEDFADEYLNELRLEYSRSIYDKLRRIEEYIKNYSENPSIETQEKFRNEIHKIAGGAATYGYPNVTKICKEMESKILSLKDFSPVEVLAKIKIYSFFHRLKQELIIPESLSDEQNIEEITTVTTAKERLFFSEDEEIELLYVKLQENIDLERKLRSYFSNANIIIKMNENDYLFMMNYKSNPDPRKYYEKNLFQLANQLEDDSKILVCIANYPENGKGLSSLLAYCIRNLSKINHPEKKVKRDKSKRTIFLVDDDKNLVDMLRFAFENRNYRVISSLSGEEAVEKIKKMDTKSYPDLIMLDREMPDMDGIRLFEYFDEYTLQNIPIIFLSSKSSHEEILKGLKAGAVEYISKPFNLNILLEKVDYLSKNKK